MADAHGDPSLLIVDRSPITRSMFRSLLSPHAPCIVFADGVADALHRIETGSVGTVLIDDATLRASPDVEAGLRTIVAAARAKRATTIVLWPQAAVAEFDRLRATGVDRIVGKPVRSTDLINALVAMDRADPYQVSLVTQAA